MKSQRKRRACMYFQFEASCFEGVYDRRELVKWSWPWFRDSIGSIGLRMVSTASLKLSLLRSFEVTRIFLFVE